MMYPAMGCRSLAIRKNSMGTTWRFLGERALAFRILGSRQGIAKASQTESQAMAIVLSATAVARILGPCFGMERMAFEICGDGW